MPSERANRQARENQDVVLAHLRATGRPRAEWDLRKTIEQLNALGFHVIRRPDLIDRGKPTRGGVRG